MKAKLWCRRWWCWLTTSRVNSKKWVEPTQNMTHVRIGLWLTAKEHHDDGVKLLRVRIGSNIAKPNRDQGREAEVERRAIPGLHVVFLYFWISSRCVSVFFQDCEGAWIRVCYKKMTEQHTLNKLKLKTLIEWMILNRCEINRKEKHIIFLNSLSCPPKCYKWHCHYQIVWAMSFVVKKKDLDFM